MHLVLEDALGAMEERNRIVHDHWMVDSDPEVWTRHHYSFDNPKGSGLGSLERFSECANNLQRVWFRLHALNFLVPGVELPQNASAGSLMVALDRFDITPEGSARPHTS
jgi:hypothetical protein